MSTRWIDTLPELCAALAAAGRADDAPMMRRYMRDQFDFYGVKTPARRALLRAHLARHGKPDEAEMGEIAQALWAQPARECQYLANDLLERLREPPSMARLPLYERLITDKSWWDTVDTLAIRLVGRALQPYPQCWRELSDDWLASGNLWRQRTAILFQLKCAEHTDEQLLFDNLRACAGSDEFFLQKAIGWALRQYARTAPDAVLNFVEQTELAPLSRREALKHIG